MPPEPSAQLDDIAQRHMALAAEAETLAGQVAAQMQGGA
jgi:hypothetical protein